VHTNIFKRQLLLDCFKFIDLLLIVVAFLLAAAASNKPWNVQHFLDIIEMRISMVNFALFILFSLTWHLIFVHYDLYNSHRLSKCSEELLKIVKAITICSCFLFLLDSINDIKLINMVFLQYFWISSVILFCLSRIILRSLLGLLRVSGRNLRRALIIGTNARAHAYVHYLEKEKRLGYIVLGYVDNQRASSERTSHITTSPIVCDLAGFQDYIRNNVVDEIFLFLPIKSFYSELNGIIAACEEQGIIVRMFTDLFKLKFAKASIEQIGGDKLLTLYTGKMNRRKILVKEIIDYITAFILILLVSPILLVTALLIKITSPGPVFFRQDRLGLYKRRFKIIKFRTMGIDAEKKLQSLEHLNEVQGKGAFKIKNDPRVTPIGKYLRALSIDELPQLFNILKGDMSLVGPRPLTVRDYQGFSIDHQRRRFSVKPGMTCLWQTQGRSNIPFDEWMKLDMEYIDTWSLWLDIKILLQTVPAVLKTKGAH
jgi:exopolysaccharide biosynthesis polyprenyl glycosylphosphotransferase